MPGPNKEPLLPENEGVQQGANQNPTNLKPFGIFLLSLLFLPVLFTLTVFQSIYLLIAKDIKGAIQAEKGKSGQTYDSMRGNPIRTFALWDSIGVLVGFTVVTLLATLTTGPLSLLLTTFPPMASTWPFVFTLFLKLFALSVMGVFCKLPFTYTPVRKTVNYLKKKSPGQAGKDAGEKLLFKSFWFLFYGPTLTSFVLKPRKDPAEKRIVKAPKRKFRFPPLQLQSLRRKATQLEPGKAPKSNDNDLKLGADGTMLDSTPQATSIAEEKNKSGQQNPPKNDNEDWFKQAKVPEIPIHEIRHLILFPLVMAGIIYAITTGLYGVAIEFGGIATLNAANALGFAALANPLFSVLLVALIAAPILFSLRSARSIPYSLLVAIAAVVPIVAIYVFGGTIFAVPAGVVAVAVLIGLGVLRARNPKLESLSKNPIEDMFLAENSTIDRALESIREIRRNQKIIDFYSGLEYAEGFQEKEYIDAAGTNLFVHQKRLNRYINQFRELMGEEWGKALTEYDGEANNKQKLVGDADNNKSLIEKDAEELGRILNQSISLTEPLNEEDLDKIEVICNRLKKSKVNLDFRPSSKWTPYFIGAGITLLVFSILSVLLLLQGVIPEEWALPFFIGFFLFSQASFRQTLSHIPSSFYGELVVYSLVFALIAFSLAVISFPLIFINYSQIAFINSFSAPLFISTAVVSLFTAWLGKYFYSKAKEHAAFPDKEISQAPEYALIGLKVFLMLIFFAVFVLSMGTLFPLPGFDIAGWLFQVVSNHITGITLTNFNVLIAPYVLAVASISLFAAFTFFQNVTKDIIHMKEKRARKEVEKTPPDALEFKVEKSQPDQKKRAAKGTLYISILEGTSKCIAIGFISNEGYKTLEVSKEEWKAHFLKKGQEGSGFDEICAWLGKSEQGRLDDTYSKKIANYVQHENTISKSKASATHYLKWIPLVVLALSICIIVVGLALKMDAPILPLAGLFLFPILFFSAAFGGKYTLISSKGATQWFGTAPFLGEGHMKTIGLYVLREFGVVVVMGVISLIAYVSVRSPLETAYPTIAFPMALVVLGTAIFITMAYRIMKVSRQVGSKDLRAMTSGVQEVTTIEMQLDKSTTKQYANVYLAAYEFASKFEQHTFDFDGVNNDPPQERKSDAPTDNCVTKEEIISEITDSFYKLNARHSNLVAVGIASFLGFDVSQFAGILRENSQVVWRGFEIRVVVDEEEKTLLNSAEVASSSSATSSSGSSGGGNEANQPTIKELYIIPTDRTLPPIPILIPGIEISDDSNPQVSLNSFAGIESLVASKQPQIQTVQGIQSLPSEDEAKEFPASPATDDSSSSSSQPNTTHNPTQNRPSLSASRDSMIANGTLGAIGESEATERPGFVPGAGV